MFTVQGMPRSGTTLLAQCLNAHPAIVVPDETDFMVPAAHAFCLIDDPEVGRSFLADLITATDRFDATLGRWLTPERVRAEIAAAPYRFDALIASLYAALATEAGAALAGDKSPNDLAQSEILGHAGFFTGSVRTVHLVRDPRDVMVSMARLGWLNGLDVNYASQWRTANLNLRRRFEGREDAYLVIRYEDVVAEPAPVFARICEFLGVEFLPEMLSETARFSQFPEHRGMSQHAATYRPIAADSVGRYRQVFDRQTLLEVDDRAGEALAAFGYASR
jgi:hypothetical protein